ncbi:MAG: DUF4364 family protein [Ruminococcaceae bacterium]|nr:DUF4364 family protein [Oscillospiraceae bacterium]
MKTWDETKIKIYILYLIENIHVPLDMNTVTEIILFDGTVNYFIYSECIRELVKSGLIIMKEEGEKEICVLSPVGKQVLDAVDGEVMDDVKKKLLVSASRFLAYKSSPSIASASIIPGDGGCFLELSIESQEKKMMSLSLYLDNFDEAETMRMKFESDPQVLYSAILSILSGKANFFFK